MSLDMGIGRKRGMEWYQYEYIWSYRPPYGATDFMNSGPIRVFLLVYSITIVV